MSFFEKPLLIYRAPYGENYNTDFETLEFMVKSGVEVVSISPMNTTNTLGENYSNTTPIWRWYDAYDFENLERQIQKILDISPKIKLIIAIDLNTPEWFTRKLNMDSFCNLSEISLNNQWREHTKNYMRSFINYCQENHSDNVIGYVLACGKTMEWIEHNNDQPGQLKCEEYPNWCQRNNLEFNFPDFSKSHVATHGFLRDPQEEKWQIQWLKYCNELIANLAIDFIQSARSYITNDAAIGMFFGHTLYSRATGHSDCERVFATAKPDFVIGAACNTAPDIGGNSGYNIVKSMLKKYDIAFINECDRITSSSNLKISDFITLQSNKSNIWVRWENDLEDIAGLKREVGMSLINGFSFWFFNIWGNSYKTLAQRETIKELAELWKKFASNNEKSTAQVLFVIDRESDYYTNIHDEKYNDFLWNFRKTTLPNSAAAYDTAHTEDLEYLDLSNYKLIIFQNFIIMDEKKEEILRDKVCKNGRCVLFIDAPGVVRNGEFNYSNVQKLTGHEHSTQGVYTKKYTDWTSIYAADITLLKEVPTLVEIYKQANIHIYSKDAAVWSSERLLLVHHKNGGTHTIQLRENVAKVTELFSNRIVAEDCSCFKDSFESPSTHLYLLEKN